MASVEGSRPAEWPNHEGLTRSRTAPINSSANTHTARRSPRQSSIQSMIKNVVHDLSKLEVLTVSDVVRAKIAAQREALSQILQDNQGNLSKLMQAELLHQSSFVTQIIKEQHLKLKEKLRKVVTGDKTKSVRAHVSAKRHEPDIVRLIDKISFTFGVINIAVCEYFITSQPSSFWLFYTVVMVIMLFARVFRFKAIKYHYFMLDFCYFTQICCLLSIYVLPSSQLFSKILFIFANGPLSWAVPVWRNSLVFHDMDKLTTVYIHVLPNMLTYCTRWIGGGHEALSLNDFFWALIGYMFWQLLYFIKTEINDKAKLDADPEIQTSLRFLTMDYRNPMHQFVKRFMKNIGVMSSSETFDPSTLKTKVIFMGSQLVYTVLTFLPIPWLYNHQTCHLYFVIIIFVVAIYNGASFYIDVFSKRYMQQFEQRQEMQAVAQVAARIALEAAALPEGETVNPQIPPSASDRTATEAAPAAEGAPPTTPVISEDTKRLIQAATSEMIDRIMEERDELGQFPPRNMLDESNNHAVSDMFRVLGFSGMDASGSDDAYSTSEGSVSSSYSPSLPASRSCPDLRVLSNFGGGDSAPQIQQQQQQQEIPTLQPAPSTLRKRTMVQAHHSCK